MVVAAVFVGTRRSSVPAKDDTVAEELAFKAKCVGYHGYGAYIRSLKR